MQFVSREQLTVTVTYDWDFYLLGNSVFGFHLSENSATKVLLLQAGKELWIHDLFTDRNRKWIQVFYF
jgi:hypothetical protein